MKFAHNITIGKVVSHTEGKWLIPNKLVKVRNVDFSLANLIADDTYLYNKELYPMQDARKSLPAYTKRRTLMKQVKLSYSLYRASTVMEYWVLSAKWTLRNWKEFKEPQGQKTSGKIQSALVLPLIKCMIQKLVDQNQ